MTTNILCLIDFRSDRSPYSLLFNAAQVILGSIFLAIISQVAIPLPFSPVPITMQTFGVFVLAITLGKVRAPLAIVTYLIQGTMGLPVFSGGSCNPLWFIGPRAGYLFGFIVAAYLIGALLRNPFDAPFWKKTFTLIVSNLIILIMGYGFLSFLIGYREAFLFGVLPFLLGDAIKIGLTLMVIQGKKIYSSWE